MTQVVQAQTKAIPIPTMHITSQQQHVIDQIQVSELTGNGQ